MIRGNNIKSRVLRCADVLEICMYCGEPADDREHVYPRSLFRNNTPKVWACSECNNIASNRLFDCIEDKRDFIHKKIRKKYKWVFKTPNWDKDEINQLGYVLKTEILSAIRLKEIITRRLEWKTSVDAMIVAKALQSAHVITEEAEDGSGNVFVEIDAVIDGIRPGDLKRWYWVEQSCAEKKK